MSRKAGNEAVLVLLPRYRVRLMIQQGGRMFMFQARPFKAADSDFPVESCNPSDRAAVSKGQRSLVGRNAHLSSACAGSRFPRPVAPGARPAHSLEIMLM
jgi:hypothetical protein